MIAYVEVRPLNDQELSGDAEWAWRDYFAADPNPFLSPHWARMVSRTHGRTFVALLHDEDGLAGVLPFQRGPFFRIERAGGDLSDRFGVVAAPTFRPELREVVRHLGGLRMHFSHGPCWADGRDQIGLRLDLTGDFWARVDKDFRKKLFRRRRQIAADIGPLRFTWHAPSNVAALIETKRAQYARTGARGALRHSWARDLVAMAATATDQHCSGQLATLHAGDRWVASALNLRCGDTLHGWLPVYDPALTKYGPGHLLRAAIIDAASEHGVQTMDMGEGLNPHKLEYPTERYAMKAGVYIAAGWRGIVGRAISAVEWRLAR